MRKSRPDSGRTYKLVCQGIHQLRLNIIRQSRPDSGRTYETVKAKFQPHIYETLKTRFWPLTQMKSTSNIRQSRPDYDRTYKTVKARFWSHIQYRQGQILVSHIQQSRPDSGLTYKTVEARFWPWLSVQVKAPTTMTNQHGQGAGLGILGEGIRGLGG